MPPGMYGFTRRVFVGVLVGALAGCAGLAPREGGEVLFVVETPVALGRIVFDADRGAPFELATAAEGTTIYRRWVSAGMYCMREVTTGNLSVGYSARIPSPICVQVEPGQQVYGGHLQLQKTGMRRIKSPERLHAQLADPSIPVVAHPPLAADMPFEP